MRKTPGTSIAMLLAVSGALSACGSDDGEPYAYAPLAVSSTSPSPAAGSPSPTDSEPTDGWVRNVDASGVSFELPHEVEPEETTTETADGSEVTRRMYQSRDVSVAVAEGMGPDTYDPATPLSAMASQLELEGATDVETTGPTDTTFGEFDGVTSTVSFTATNGDPSQLFMVTITVGDLLVMIQANDFESEADGVTKALDRVAQSVRLD